MQIINAAMNAIESSVKDQASTDKLRTNPVAAALVLKAGLEMTKQPDSNLNDEALVSTFLFLCLLACFYDVFHH